MIFTALLRFYKRFLSPWLPARCRFYPSCADYTIAAIEKWGNIKGLYLGTKRLLRCHPFSQGGFDPVP